MIATRYLPALACILALACVPTVLHSYMGMTVHDSIKVDDVALQLNGLSGRSSGRSPAWVADTYGTSDFIERQYGGSLTLFVARSYDAKSLYHHPENGVAHGEGYDRAVVTRRADRPDVPIFALRNDRGGRSVYTLLYGTEFVEHPIRFQLKNALELLVRPKALMTLIFVRANAGAGASAPEDLLLAAVDSFLGLRGRTAP